MEEIKDFNTYVSGMKKSYIDKLFFMDKVKDINTVVDFGCADGAMIREMYKAQPELKYIGIDNNPAMIDIANIKTDKDCNIDYITEFNNSISYSNAVLNLSSVIHEVYSYCKYDEIKEFWTNVFWRGFKYISIRDFCVSKTVNRTADMNDYTKLVRSSDEYKIGNLVNDFESIWGSLRDNRNMIHFLLKYRYKSNWDREVRENYFPITLEQLLSLIPTDKYEIVYFEDYVLPFTKDTVKHDFDIDLHDNTHVKLLLRRKSELCIV